MLEIDSVDNGPIRLRGWFDATQVSAANAVFDEVTTSCVVDFEGLEYISSAGLGLLLRVQRRLSDSGHALTLIHLSPHIENVFMCAGFNHVFTIE